MAQTGGAVGQNAEVNEDGGRGTRMFCDDTPRRRVVAAYGFTGIDEIEADGKKLCVRFFGAIPSSLTKKDIRIEGGRRIRDLRVTEIEVKLSDDPDLDSCLSITLDREGDFSVYTLRIVPGRTDKLFDTRYASADFLFHPDCPRDQDCLETTPCPPEPRRSPELDYRAKDYASFRALLFDRYSQIIPEWKERHVPDVGVAVTEIMAYVGDYLSYYQDAVAAEAYLETAHQRISVRRHARLVDYLLHEGCNARAFVCLQTTENIELSPKDFSFATLTPEMRQRQTTVFAQDDLRSIHPADFTVFEPMGEAAIRLRVAHNEILFHTWGGAECCLPKGATRASLRDAAPPDDAQDNTKDDTADTEQDAAKPPERILDLRVGDLLMFEEVLGPRTGNRTDADAAHRHAVRLTRITPDYDRVEAVNVLEVEWGPEDALPFPLCLSSELDAPQCAPRGNVSVARGNVVLADHGRRIEETLGTVETKAVKAICRCEGGAEDVTIIPKPFSPALRYAPLTYAEPTPPANTPASRLMKQDPRRAAPQIRLAGNHPAEAVPTQIWEARFDLLDADAKTPHFCVETDNDAKAHLRFGDGISGEPPQADTTFSAQYRFGCGTAGNIGAETLRAIIFRERRDGIGLTARNPLPAVGGVAPEALASAKLYAPGAFRLERRRAVIPEDFAAFAERDPRVQRAFTALRWTGSWYEAQTAIDAKGRETPPQSLLNDMEAVFSRVRRIGWDAVAIGASLIPVQLTLKVCIRPEYIAAQVVAVLKAKFSARILPDGTRGFFHPDNQIFGQGVAVSRIVAAAQSVPGVLSVQVQELHRYGEAPQQEIENGVLTLTSEEIAELEDDPNFPERGKLTITSQGGR